MELKLGEGFPSLPVRAAQTDKNFFYLGVEKSTPDF
jgi:hypothetical protein